MNTTKKVIMADSDEAASIKTVTGWVSSTGHFWGKDERMARFDGSTHKICDKNPAPGVVEQRSWCEACRAERMTAKWEAMPRREYDGEPVCVFDSDTYFFAPEEIADWLLDNDIKLEDARLVFCKPKHPEQIDPNEHYQDDLPEDGEVSAALAEAFDALNKIIEAQPPLSWWEGDEAVVLPDDFLGSAA